MCNVYDELFPACFLPRDIYCLSEGGEPGERAKTREDQSICRNIAFYSPHAAMCRLSPGANLPLFSDKEREQTERRAEQWRSVESGGQWLPAPSPAGEYQSFYMDISKLRIQQQ